MFEGTIFAYGQSGSGKTYTMSGSMTESGIIGYAISDIFDFIDQVWNLFLSDFLLFFVPIFNVLYVCVLSLLCFQTFYNMYDFLIIFKNILLEYA